MFSRYVLHSRRAPSAFNLDVFQDILNSLPEVHGYFGPSELTIRYSEVKGSIQNEVQRCESIDL